MPGKLPQFYMFPSSHGNISFQERVEEIKRELFMEGEVLVLVCSPKV
jgi:hypothetical protein